MRPKSFGTFEKQAPVTTSRHLLQNRAHTLPTRKQRVYSVICFLIDLFSLYGLFSHFRPRDATRGNSFFQMSSHARANLRITNAKTKGKFPCGHHVV